MAKISAGRFPRSLVILLCLVILLTTFLVGLFIGRQRGERAVVPEGEGQILQEGDIPSSLSEDISFSQFWDVWNLLKERYYRQPVSEKNLFYGAMRGMVAALEDPYTSFFDPEEAAQFESVINGSFEGIGAEIGIEEEQLQIIAPLAGSPAQQAGILAGDFIFEIDGEDTFGMTIEEAVTKIRGPRGTSVLLTIGREGVEEPLKISIVRDTITLDSVVWHLREDGIAVLSIYTLREDVQIQFTQAVNELLAEGATGLIVDVRNNSGGLLDACIAIVGSWTGTEPVVREKIQEEERIYRSQNTARLAQMPTVVLVNGGSASASEILTGALQDYDLATIIGTQTYGKGSVQTYQELPDGSGFKFTIAEWLTPLGRSIHEVGIEPDVIVEYTMEDAEAGKDPQLEAAVEWLNSH